MIKANSENNSQRAALSYLQRYIQGLDDEKLTKFLRFCTSATILCVESIEVTFTDLDGTARRPVAHTCRSVLELPTTYQSFPQFRQETNAIFSSEYWDILLEGRLILSWLIIDIFIQGFHSVSYMFHSLDKLWFGV